MRGFLAGASVFTGVLLVAALGMAPASWFDLALVRASGGVFSLTGGEGSIWNGKGMLQAVLPHGKSVVLEPIRWSVPGADLLRGWLHLQVFSERSGELLADLGMESVGPTLHSLQMEFPAVLLGTISPTLRQAGLAGTLRVQGSDIRLSGRMATGTATIVWSKAASALADSELLGSYRIVVSGDAGGLACRLTTLDAGALKLTGDCRLSPGQPFRVDGTAELAESHKGRLAPLMRFLGRETRPGIYQLQVAPGFGLG